MKSLITFIFFFSSLSAFAQVTGSGTGMSGGSGSGTNPGPESTSPRGSDLNDTGRTNTRQYSRDKNNKRIDQRPNIKSKTNSEIDNETHSNFGD